MNIRQNVLITFDVDWSPDWMIDQVSEIMMRNRIKSTWFATHASPAIGRLRARTDLFELGIHPNCLPGSTHGSDDVEVLRHVKSIVPDAVSMRSHGLYQTSAFLILAARDFGIRLESNVLMPGASDLAPCDLCIDDIVMRRVPFFWADDAAMRDPRTEWQKVGTYASAGGGLRVFAFHPFHVVTNMSEYERYNAMKRQRPISAWTPDFVEVYRSTALGVGTVLQSLAQELTGRPTLFLKDLLEAEASA